MSSGTHTLLYVPAFYCFGSVLTYVQSHPTRAKYRNATFPLYEEIDELLNGALATGKSAFHPGKAILGHVSDSDGDSGRDVGLDLDLDEDDEDEDDEDDRSNQTSSFSSLTKVHWCGLVCLFPTV